MYMYRIYVCMMNLVMYRVNLMSDRMDLIGCRILDVGRTNRIRDRSSSLLSDSRKDGRMGLVGGRRRYGGSIMGVGRMGLVGCRRRVGGIILDVGRMGLVGGRRRDRGSILDVGRMGLVGGRRRDGGMGLVGNRYRCRVKGDRMCTQLKIWVSIFITIITEWTCTLEVQIMFFQ
jgi:hypothetical protein